MSILILTWTEKNSLNLTLRIFSRDPWKLITVTCAFSQWINMIQLCILIIIIRSNTRLFCNKKIVVFLRTSIFHPTLSLFSRVRKQAFITYTFIYRFVLQKKVTYKSISAKMSYLSKLDKISYSFDLLVSTQSSVILQT